MKGTRKEPLAVVLYLARFRGTYDGLVEDEIAKEDAIPNGPRPLDKWAYQMPLSSYPGMWVGVVMQINVVLAACAAVMGAYSR